MKDLAKELCEPLMMIFNKSWCPGEVLEGWKKAYIEPTFIKVKRDDLSNYRPVNLTSIPGKILEQLI